MGMAAFNRMRELKDKPKADLNKSENEEVKNEGKRQKREPRKPEKEKDAT